MTTAGKQVVAADQKKGETAEIGPQGDPQADAQPLNALTATLLHTGLLFMFYKSHI